MISDFRVRDVAAGGEGAPLVPLVDHLLFRAAGRKRAPCRTSAASPTSRWSATRLADLVAFDNGPGNMPLDTVARAASRGAEAFDRDGRRAARGRIDAGLLAELHRHPYLAQPPAQVDRPRGLRQELRLPAARPLRTTGKDDLLATLTRFSAEAIARSYRETLPALPDEVYVSGGGALNPTLMRHLGRAARADPGAEPPPRWASIPTPRRRSPSPSSPTRPCSAPPATSPPSPAPSARASSGKLSF